MINKKTTTMLVALIMLSTIGIVTATDRATLDTKVTVPQPAVASINISTTTLDFASVYAGKSSSQTITISNDGATEVTISITPTDMVSSSGNRIPSTRISTNPQSPITISAGSTLNEQLTLDVPADVAPGSYSGNVDIVATLP